MYIDRILLKIKNKEKKTVQEAEKQKKEKAKKKKKTSVGAFTAAAYSAISDYFFRDSFILDSGATLHICNRYFRFQDFKQAMNEQYIYAGTTRTKIEGYGTVDITVQIQNRSRSLILLNMALIFIFHINTVFLRRFKNKKIY